MSSRKRIVICGGGAIGTAIAYFKARQACFRPVTEDGLPLIGAMPGIDGGYVSTGHSVWGMLNAPATGEAMSELILDGAARRASTSRHSRQGACRRLTPRVCTAVQADARHPTSRAPFCL
jgi:glycine/D-amino acid oxidase-like deaminating enzyme